MAGADGRSEMGHVVRPAAGARADVLPDWFSAPGACRGRGLFDEIVLEAVSDAPRLLNEAMTSGSGIAVALEDTT